MSDFGLLFIGVPLGIGAAALFGMLLQPRDSNRRRFTKIDRVQRFHGEGK